MDYTGVPAPQLDWDSANLPEAWQRFRQHAELMFTGPYKSKPEEEQCSYLLIWVGDQGRQIYNTWTGLTLANKKLLKTYYDKFEEYVKPKANTTFLRYRFNRRVQGESEKFEQFFTDLKLLANECNFCNVGTCRDERIIERIVFGVRSDRAREKLIEQGSDLKLDKAVDFCRTRELSDAQMKSVAQTEATGTVHAVGKKPHKRSGPNRFQTKGHEGQSRAQPAESQGDSTGATGQKCGNCGFKHYQPGRCPASGTTCAKCGRQDHWARVCQQQQRTAGKDSKVHSVDSQQPDDPNGACSTATGFYVESIQTPGSNQQPPPDQVFTDIKVGNSGQVVNFKLDTGSQVNVIPASIFRDVGRLESLQPTKQQLFGYSGKMLDAKGKCRLKCKYKDRDVDLDFYIVNTQAHAVLGLQACLSLELIQLIMSVDTAPPPPMDNTILKEFEEVFNGIGLFAGEHHIQVDKTVQPVVHAPRRVPHALRPKLKQELDRMVEQGIAVPVEEPTDWVSSLVIVEKPKSNSLRICLDPRDLNKAIKREYHPMPTLDDITAKLAGATCFSVLDARSGYWQIKLTEESSLLLTFNTPFGRYRFTRMPFGIHSAQDVFQRKVDETYQGLSGVTGIVDDIVVYGRTKEEHDANLRAMLQRTRERGVKLNAEKCVIRVPRVPYFGHVLTSEGLQPDPSKIAAIEQMEPPANKAELETILGMVNYLAKFAPRLAEVTAPLRDLLKKNNEFLWDSQQDVAFRAMKELMTQQPGPVLAYYDASKDSVVQVDASKSGLGATLLQEGRPVVYASKSLSMSEQNWAQIEKEMYAITFGCERFHQYLYGRHVTVVTDHKPLESIFKKPLAAVPARLQRLMLRLQKYQISVVHQAGKDIPVADTLSRKYMQCSDSSIGDSADVQVHTVMSSLPVSDQKLDEIRRETEADPQMQELQQLILDGWPDKRQQCPITTREFWNHRDELTVSDKLILKGEHIVMPPTLRAEMLTKIHLGHMGMEKCKDRARDVMFWPGMCAQIDQTVANCHVCLENRRSNTKEPMIPHQTPTRPWQVVGTDLFQWNNDVYLVVVDYYSRYPEMTRLTTTTSAMVINKMKSFFARHGIPEKVVSDNGPQYASAEFARFAAEWSFQHVTSSPLYPQSNGLAEKYVHIMKRLLTKAKADASDPYLCLLEYRNTPIDGIASPAQLLMSRRQRSLLPATTTQLQPQTQNPARVQQRLHENKVKQKTYYDRNTATLPPLVKGESVRIQRQNGQWKPAIVTGLAGTRSYNVHTEDGGDYTRNRRHLMQTGERHQEQPAVPEATTPRQPEATTPPSASTPQAATPRSTPQTQHYTTRFGRKVIPRKTLDM